MLCNVNMYANVHYFYVYYMFLCKNFSSVLV